MSCILWNSQSLNNKIDDVIQILQDNSQNIGLFSETWLRSQKNHVTSLLNESGFKICHSNRSDMKGGGVAVVSKCGYQPKFEKFCNYTSFECVIQTLMLCSNVPSLTLIVIYRHGAECISVFLDEFHDFLEYVTSNFKCFIISGDFNIHVNKVNESSTIKFNDILNTFSLVQSIKVSTHKLGNTLDLLIHDPTIITICDIIVDSEDRPGSDHYIINFKFMCNIAVIDKREIHYRDYKNLVLPNFHDDIINCNQRYVVNADPNDFKSSLDLYVNTYGNIVNNHAPIVNKVVNTVTRPPWMDLEFVTARKERRQLYKKWKRQKTDQSKSNFIQSRAAVNALAKQKRCTYYQEQIKSSNNSQGELFKVFYTLVDDKKQSELPYSEDYNVLANSFNNFFVSKIENIRKNFTLTNDTVILEEVNTNISTFSEFNAVTAEDILKIIKSSKIKTTSNDPIPAFLLKSSVEHILPSLVHLVNVSLQTGSMDGLKDSTVTPILKKAGLEKNTLSNYRPVCAGLYLDKLIQKSALGQLNEHMSLNDLHIPYQSGYKTHHNCETVLLKIVNDIHLNLDSGYCTVLLLLDLSAAFDTVDLEKLFYILSNEIGLRGTVLDWFRSFLSNRKQSTNVKGCISDYIPVKYGVPQGSVLGPVLFNIYIRNFIRVLREAGYIVHGYADDHHVLTAFRIEFQFETLAYSLPSCLNLITDWMTSHFLKLNAGKSNLLIFSPKNLRDKMFFDRVYLGNNIFIPVSFNAMNLGVKLDSELSFSPQISMILSQSYAMISSIGKIKRYLTANDLRCLVQCVIMSKLDNCNSLYYGIPEYEINRLQKLQNSCARLIYNRKRSDHVSDLFAELHWLPVKQRIIFKILLFVFKIFYDISPEYIKDCVIIIDPLNRILKMNRVNTAYGERAFSNCAPKLWNALPDYLRHSNTISYFKGHLKNYFFTSFLEFLNKVNRYRV